MSFIVHWSVGLKAKNQVESEKIVEKKIERNREIFNGLEYVEYLIYQYASENLTG